VSSKIQKEVQNILVPGFDEVYKSKVMSDEDKKSLLYKKYWQDSGGIVKYPIGNIVVAVGSEEAETDVVKGFVDTHASGQWY
jgi:hypothetical protein